MTLLLLPDAVQVVTGFLRAQPEVRRLVDDRVYSVLPQKPTWPAARIVQWSEQSAIDRPLVLVTAACQIDAWAHRKVEASYLGRTVRAALAERLVEQRSGLVSAVTFGTVADAPDTDYEPALPRYRFDIFVTVRQGEDAPSPAVPASDVPSGVEPIGGSA